MSNIDLFLELANPNPKTGESRWVSVTEFTGRYARLVLGNGWSWGRKSSPLQKKYNVETDKSRTPGNSIDRIKLCGYRKDESFSQSIRPDIKATLRAMPCVMLGVCGTSENTSIEVDHKDGRKNDLRVSNMSTQKLSDFQPLCKAANDVKRQICKECRATGKRWDARNIPGNPYSFYEGGVDFTESLGCVGCYQYDPVAYRKVCVQRLLSESDPCAFKKLYPEG